VHDREATVPEHDLRIVLLCHQSAGLHVGVRRARA
jgi:hypothetical protein